MSGDLDDGGSSIGTTTPPMVSRRWTSLGVRRFCEHWRNWTRGSKPITKKTPTLSWPEGCCRASWETTAGVVEGFSRVIELEPDNALTHLNRRICLTCQERYEEAVGDFDRAVEIDPEDTESYFQRGIAHIELGRCPKAIEDRDRAVSLDSQYPYAESDCQVATDLTQRQRRRIIPALWALGRANHSPTPCPGRLRQDDRHAAGDRLRQPGQMPHFPAGQLRAFEPLGHAVIVDAQAFGELLPRQTGKLNQPVQPLAEVLREEIQVGPSSRSLSSIVIPAHCPYTPVHGGVPYPVELPVPATRRAMTPPVLLYRR